MTERDNTITPEIWELLEKQMKIMNHEQPDDNKNDAKDFFPEWFDGKKIDESAFSEYILDVHPIKCVNGILYDVDGMVDLKKFEKELYDMITPYVKSNLAKCILRLLEAVRIKAYCEDLPIRTDRIHVANGTLYLDGRFEEKKDFCRNRLPVSYDPGASPPVTWLGFLSELLNEDDIPALQEFMGYTLIPTNKAQTMLLITGKGGEGKSRIGRVMRAILGDNMNTSSIQKLATDRFARADQEGKLLMLDDDMKTEALPETNMLKSIVTIEDKMDLERKGKQSRQGYLYVRIMGFGNGSLTALYDRSDGFYRRQLALVVKDKDENRKDDRDLGDKLIAEAEGIFLWCLEGLRRLIANEYNFSISAEAKKRMEDEKKEANNIIEFLESEGYIRFEKNTTATSKALYTAYAIWCDDNALKPFSDRTFTGYLKNNADKLGIIYDKNIYIDSGKTARGYHGVHVQIRTDGIIRMRSG